MRYIGLILTIVTAIIFTSSLFVNVSAQQNQNMPKAANSPELKGAELLAAELEFPDGSSYQTYLNISSKKFNISDIKSDVVLVQIFSMYCPHCQKDAPNMNTFFNMIRNSEIYKDKIKLIGIGVGNSLFEVDFFRKTYSVEFPLFSDQDFKIHKLLGEVRTPYFIGIKRLKDGSNKVFLSEAGGDREPEQFLNQIIKQAQLQ